MPDSKRTSLRAVVLFVGGVMGLASFSAAALLSHDLPERRMVGSQERAERHRRASLHHAGDAVGRCIDAVPIDRRRCTSTDEARDRDFYRSVPHKR